VQSAEKRRCDAIAAAEQGLRDFAANINEALAAAKEIDAGFSSLGHAAPFAAALPARLGERAVAILGTINGHLSRFGRLAYPASWRGAGDDWKELERRELASTIDTLKRSIR
jgi:hypothetical protein